MQLVCSISSATVIFPRLHRQGFKSDNCWGQETLLLAKLSDIQGVPVRLAEVSSMLGWAF